MDQIRPDRQTLLFSATTTPKIDEMSKKLLVDPVKIVVGKENCANEDIT